MIEIKRQSPIRFNAEPEKIEVMNHRPVVLAYKNEGPGPWIADLSHKSRWDFQAGDMDDNPPEGHLIPSAPGTCRMEKETLISRMNPTQAVFWDLGRDASSGRFKENAFTDVTEATAFLALFGPGIFNIAEKLSALDFLNSGRTPPFLLQGPFSRVPCRLVLLQRETTGRNGSGSLLLTCARGYGRDMADAILDAGTEFGLRPAGENIFDHFLKETFEQD